MFSAPKTCFIWLNFVCWVNGLPLSLSLRTRTRALNPANRTQNNNLLHLKRLIYMFKHCTFTSRPQPLVWYESFIQNYMPIKWIGKKTLPRFCPVLVFFLRLSCLPFNHWACLRTDYLFRFVVCFAFVQNDTQTYKSQSILKFNCPFPNTSTNNNTERKNPATTTADNTQRKLRIYEKIFHI